jgi:hypothetical protein
MSREAMATQRAQHRNPCKSRESYVRNRHVPYLLPDMSTILAEWALVTVQDGGVAVEFRQVTY